MENLENRKIEIEKEIMKLNNELTAVNKELKEIQTYRTIIICIKNIYAKNLLKIKQDFTTILQISQFENIEDLGVRKLAYEIKGNKEGYYIEFTYKSKTSNIVELEKYIRENKQIIKFLTIKENEI